MRAAQPARLSPTQQRRGRNREHHRHHPDRLHQGERCTRQCADVQTDAHSVHADTGQPTGPSDQPQEQDRVKAVRRADCRRLVLLQCLTAGAEQGDDSGERSGCDVHSDLLEVWHVGLPTVPSRPGLNHPAGHRIRGGVLPTRAGKRRDHFSLRVRLYGRNSGSFGEPVGHDGRPAAYPAAAPQARRREAKRTQPLLITTSARQRKARLAGRAMIAEPVHPAITNPNRAATAAVSA